MSEPGPDEPWTFGGIHANDLDAYLLSADPVGQVLKGHLAIEAVLGEALDVRMERPDDFRQMKLSFARKVRLCVALGILNEGEAGAFQALNSIRNSLAHEYHYEIKATDAESLLEALPQWWKENEVVSSTRAGSDVSGQLRLGVLVIYTMAGKAVER